MKIWFINHYAGLPKTVPATRTYDIAKHLAKLGHHVTIFACSLNHYTFAEEHLGFGQLIKLEECEGVRLVWIRGTGYRKNGLRRLINMLVFSWLVFIVGIYNSQKPDIIIGTTVHPFAPLSSYWVSRIRRTRFWLDITDIWPESLIDLGYLDRTSPIAKIITAIEGYSLRKAELIMSVVPNINDYVHDKGLQTPTLWTPNGIDANRIPTFPTSWTNNESFIVMYAGGFAPAHALEVVLDAAHILELQEIRNIKLVLVGDGIEMPKVKSFINTHNLKNVELPGFVPKKDLYNLLGSADALLVTGKNLPVYRYGVGFNKIPDYMCIGRPIIFALSSSNNPISDARAGISIEGQEPQLLVDAMVKLSQTPIEERLEMGKRARIFSRENFDYAMIAQRLSSYF